MKYQYLVLVMCMFVFIGCGKDNGEIFPVMSPSLVNASLSDGIYQNPQRLQLMCVQNNSISCAAIYYSSEPPNESNNFTKYQTALAINASTELYFFAKNSTGEIGKVETVKLVIDEAAPVVRVSLKSGIYSGEQYTNLFCEDVGGAECDAIYYTLNGDEPNVNSNKYVDGIVVKRSSILKYIAIDTIGNISSVESVSYTISSSSKNLPEVKEDQTIPTGKISNTESILYVSASQDSGIYNHPITTSLSCRSSAGYNCRVFYALNEQPLNMNSDVSRGPLLIDRNATLKYQTVDSMGNKSAIVSRRYIIDTIPPVIAADHASATVNRSFSLELNCQDYETNCAAIYYSVDGSEPDKNSMLYSAPIAIEKSLLIKVRAYDLAGNASEVLALDYQFDSLAPEITFSQPQNGVTRFGLNDSVLIEFNETINEQSLAVENLQLIAEDNTLVPLQARFNAETKVLILTPEVALEKATVYQLSLQGIEDQAGNLMSAGYIDFRTTDQEMLVSRNVDNDVNWYDMFSYDVEGNLQLVTRYNSRGADDVWFSDDDIVESRKTFSIDQETGEEKVISYIASGVDELWGTDDDVLGAYSEFDFDAISQLNQIVLFTSPGADTLWFTVDDEVQQVMSYQLNLSADIDVVRYASQAGVDGLWFTEDDVLYQVDQYIYDSDQQLKQVTSYSNAGEDAVWLTEDDIPVAYQTSTFSKSKSLVERKRYAQPGDDAIWFNEDDVLLETQNQDLNNGSISLPFYP